jgi:AcrR family transcriptional regulator
MSRPRAADYEQARHSILLHAVSAFSRVGYPSASMSELALASGTSKAGLYHYYPSKEALLFDCLKCYTQDLSELAASVTALNNSPKETLKRLISAFLDKYSTSRDFHIALLHDVKFLSKTQQEAIKQQERTVVQIFADVIQAAFPASVTSTNLKPLTMSLLGAMNFTFAWLRDDGTITYGQYAQWIADLWMLGLEHGKFPTDNPSPFPAGETKT